MIRFWIVFEIFCTVSEIFFLIIVQSTSLQQALFVFPPLDAGEEMAEVDAGSSPVVAQVVDVGDVSSDVKGAVVNVTSMIEADVLVDGKKFGRTPQELELMPGPHTIIVRNTTEGVEKKVQWKLKAGETKTLSVPAPSAAPVVVKKGRLHVNAPPFCALSIDGKRQAGAAVAVWEVDLSEGKHSISCTLEDPSLPKPRVKTQSVVISADRESKLAFDMMAP